MNSLESQILQFARPLFGKKTESGLVKRHLKEFGSVLATCFKAKTDENQQFRVQEAVVVHFVSTFDVTFDHLTCAQSYLHSLSLKLYTVCVCASNSNMLLLCCPTLPASYQKNIIPDPMVVQLYRCTCDALWSQKRGPKSGRAVAFGTRDCRK